MPNPTVTICVCGTRLWQKEKKRKEGIHLLHTGVSQKQIESQIEGQIHRSVFLRRTSDVLHDCCQSKREKTAAVNLLMTGRASLTTT